MEFIKKNINLFILLFLAILCLILTGDKCSNILIDVGREVYYPELILGNKVLYKDIFCIYGPLSYLLNAFFYKIFGANLGTLYFLGGICALSILIFTYNFSKKFLSEFNSFVISFFVIATGYLSIKIFNYILPYSYAILYGVVFFILSLYFLIKFKEDNKEKNLILSSLFAGFCISSKYDFIPYFLVLVFFIVKSKSYKSLLSFLFGLFLPFFILILQGARINDFINGFIAIKSFSKTEALKTFYITQGVYYTKRVWAEWFMEIFNLSVALFFLYLGQHFFKLKNVFNKFFGIIAFLVGIILAFNNAHADSYLFLTFFTSVFFILSFALGQVKKDFSKLTNIENVFIISSILISLKSFWGLSHGNYGLYFLPFILISFFILSKKYFTKNCNNVLCFLLLIMGISYFYNNYNQSRGVNFLIDTKKGKIETIKSIGAPTVEILDFINNLKDDNPKIMIYPEGLMINFLSNKKTETEDFYNSLIPLYTEGFSEDKIIKELENEKLDYIILSDIKVESYGRGEICKTYAKNICAYIYKNYTPIFKTISSDENSYTVYKKN